VVDARRRVQRIAGGPRSVNPALGGCRAVPVDAGTVGVVETLILT